MTRPAEIHQTLIEKERLPRMAPLDWSQCAAVESVPGRLDGVWVFRETPMPVSAMFENIEAGASIDEIVEQFDVTREQINAVLALLLAALFRRRFPPQILRADARPL